MHYLSKVIGTGTDDDPQRPALADHGVDWAAVVPTDPTGKAASDWCLVDVLPESVLLARVSVDDLTPAQGALKKAAIVAAYARLRADTQSCVPLPAVATFMPSDATRGDWTAHPLAAPILSTVAGAKTHREFIERIGRLLEPTFDARRFGVK